MKCITGIAINSMEIELITMVFLWILLGILAIALIFLRDDWELFINDIGESFNDAFIYGILHIVVFIFYAPLTIPFSIKYFIDKWK